MKDRDRQTEQLLGGLKEQRENEKKREQRKRKRDIMTRTLIRVEGRERKTQTNVKRKKEKDTGRLCENKEKRMKEKKIQDCITCFTHQVIRK